MRIRHLIFLLCSASITALFLLNGHAPKLMDMAPPNQASPQKSLQLPRANQLPTKSNSASSSSSEIDLNTWPSSIISALKDSHPGFDEAIDHIVQSTAFEHFAALDSASAERLIRYAQNVRIQPSQQIPHLCWAPHTSVAERTSYEDVRSLAISQNTNLVPQPIFQAKSRWTYTATDGVTGAEGTPITITWSFVPDGTVVPNGGADENENPTTAASDLIARLNATYGAPETAGDLTTAPWFELFENAFAFWAEATGNQYVYEPNDSAEPMLDFPNGALGTRGDVRIGGTLIDGNGSTLAFNYYPNAGDMVIDSHDSSNLALGQEMLFTNILAHEHGHGLGLGHVCPVDSTKLMEPYASSAFYGTQFDDELSAQELYGDPFERHSVHKNNDTSFTAYDLGTLHTSFHTDTASITNDADQDLFKFQLSEPKSLTLTITPSEQPPYLEGEQNANGSCTTGTLFHPKTRQDLSIRILASDGNTVIASADDGLNGIAENIINLPLNQTASNYYIEINGGNENSSADNNIQAYTIDLDLVDLGPAETTAIQLTQEAYSPANGTPDPDEMVTVELTVENNNVQTAENVSITLTGSANLNVVGNSTQNLPDLAANSSTTINYTFSLSGNCGDTETLTFRIDTDSGFTERTQNYRLGSVSTLVSENFDSFAIDTIPTEYSESSSQPATKWRIVDTLFTSSPHAIYAPGKTGDDTVSSAYLTTPRISTITAQTELIFEHYYSTEENYDGGILEISIDDGATWNEWTDAGGTFTQNGYNETIVSDDTNPIKNRAAWTGESNVFLSTIAKFPPSAIGQDVRVRWHMSSDQYAQSIGWFIDSIRITQIDCLSSSIPTITVTPLPATVSEFTPNITANFILSANINVNDDLLVSFTLSGDAVADSDYVALVGSATIPSGQDMIAVPVTAITDSEIEGDELLTMTLSPSSAYDIATASASITIQDLPFDQYRKDYFGSSTTNIADDEDFDSDGIHNLAEYAFRLDPTTTSTLPFSIEINDSGQQTLELSYYEDTESQDIQYIVETSSTLAIGSWTTTGVTITEGSTTNGLKSKTASIVVGNQPGFVRIRIERLAP